MTEEERRRLDGEAIRVLDCLNGSPTLRIEELSTRLGISQSDIVAILDSYSVLNGSPSYTGVGQGGGWIPESLRETLVTGYGDDPSHIGYRWPDGSLHEEQYQSLEQQVFGDTPQ